MTAAGGASDRLHARAVLADERLIADRDALRTHPLRRQAVTEDVERVAAVELHARDLVERVTRPRTVVILNDEPLHEGKLTEHCYRLIPPEITAACGP